METERHVRSVFLASATQVSVTQDRNRIQIRLCKKMILGVSIWGILKRFRNLGNKSEPQE